MMNHAFVWLLSVGCLLPLRHEVIQVEFEPRVKQRGQEDSPGPRSAAGGAFVRGLAVGVLALATVPRVASRGLPRGGELIHLVETDTLCVDNRGKNVLKVNSKRH